MEPIRAVAIVVFTAAGATSISCRLLRSIRCWFSRKDAPPLLPYWIPWLGHGLSYMMNARALVDSAHKRYGSLAPFTIVLGGQTVHVVGDPTHVKHVYRLNKVLTLEPVAIEIVAQFGVGIEAANTFKTTIPAEHIEGVTGETSLSQLSHTFFREELTSRRLLDILTERYLTALDTAISGIDTRLSSNKSLELSIWTLCRETVFEAFVNAMYGPSLLRKHPDTFAVYNSFDEEFYKIVMQFPNGATVNVRRQRERMIDILDDYYSDSETVEATAADFISRLHKIMARHSSMTTRQLAASQLSILWGASTNSIKVAFWALVFVCSRPLLVRQLRDEFAPAFGSHSTPSVEYLIKSCPLFNAVYQETLRMSMAPSSMRLVEEDTLIGGYTLSKGDRVLLPSMHLHRSKEFWGDDADEFRPERMLEMIERKIDVVTSGYLRPFGGGTSYCPGRFFSRGEVMSFVAVMLHHYDLELLGSPPAPNTRPPTLGVLDPPMPCDLRVRLATRL